MYHSHSLMNCSSECIVLKATHPHSALCWVYSPQSFSVSRVIHVESWSSSGWSLSENEDFFFFSTALWAVSSFNKPVWLQPAGLLFNHYNSDTNIHLSLLTTRPDRHYFSVSPPLILSHLRGVDYDVILSSSLPLSVSAELHFCPIIWPLTASSKSCSVLYFSGESSHQMTSTLHK